jgi:CIC family chloride channel protein
MHSILKKLSTKLVFPVIFAIVSLVGFFISDAIGSGHALVEELFRTQIAWYMLIIVFLLRAIGMMVSNTSGASGGVFLPTLAFGAMIGSLSAEIMIALGWIGEEFYVLLVALGIAAFLGSTSRIPVTACVFSIEALGCINNILPVIIATAIALLVVEASGLEDFTDTVIDAKLRSLSRGKKPALIEATFTVSENAFVVGKEIRDVFWPNSCVVISFERLPENFGKPKIAAGDIITVRYSTYDLFATAEELKALVGEDSEISHRVINSDNENVSLIAN